MRAAGRPAPPLQTLTPPPGAATPPATGVPVAAGHVERRPGGELEPGRLHHVPGGLQFGPPSRRRHQLSCCNGASAWPPLTGAPPRPGPWLCVRLLEALSAHAAIPRSAFAARCTPPLSLNRLLHALAQP